MIGRFSCLSVSDSCTIISYYEGVKDIYIIYKDEGTIHIDRLSSSITTEHNGLEVSCIIERTWSNATALSRGIELLKYFPNIYVDNHTNVTISGEFNNRIIRNFDTFSFAIKAPDYSIECNEFNKYREYKVLYGNVLYPIKFPDTFQLSLLPEKNMCLRFNIGELDITPSRESLQMTKRTVSALVRKAKEFEVELQKLFEDSFGDFTNFGQVLDIISPKRSSFTFPLTKVTVNEKQHEVLLDVDDTQMLFSLVNRKSFQIITDNPKTVKVIPTKYSNALIQFLLSNNTYNYSIKLFKGRFVKSFNEDSVFTNSLLKAFRVGYYLTPDKTFSQQIRIFINSVKKDFLILAKEEDEKLFIENFKAKLKAFLIANHSIDIDQQEIQDLLGALKEWYDSKRTVISKETMPEWVVAEYRRLHPLKDKTVKKEAIKKADITFYGIDCCSDRLRKIDTTFVKNFKGKVVILERGSEYVQIISDLFKPFSASNSYYVHLNFEKTLFCVVAKSSIPACQALGYCMVEEFLNSETNGFFRRLAAIKLWLTNNNMMSKDFLSSILSKATYCIDSPLFPDVKRINYIKHIKPYLTSYSQSLNEVIDSCITNKFIDWKFYSKMPSKEEILLINFQYECFNSTKRPLRAVIAMELMRRKLIHMDVKLYKRFKLETDEYIKNWL